MKNRMYFLAAFFAFAVSHSTAEAQLYWDTNDASTGATSDGLGNASGTWSGQAVTADYNGSGVVDAADYILWRNDPGTYNGDPAGYNAYRSQFGGANVAGNSNWTTDPNGDVATVPFTLNQAAVFAAGSNANGTYTVTLGTPQSAASLTFEDSATVTIVGDATTPLTLSSSASNVNVTGAATQLATIDAVISGTNLHKVGGGTLILGGTNMTTNSLSNNYSGNTIITSAASPATSTIQLNSSNVIPDTSVVVLQGSGGTGGNNAILQMTGMTETVRSVSGVFGYIDVGNSGVLTINDQVGDVYTLGNFGSSAHLRAADFGKYDKIGSGKLVLANDAGSNFNGEFILTNGTLAYSRNGALGSGSTSKLTVKGGQLTRSTTAATLTYGVGRVDLHVFRYDNSPDPNQTNQFGAATVTTLKEVNVEFNITNTLAGTGTVNFLGRIQNNDSSETSPPDRGITKTGNGVLTFLNNTASDNNTYKGPTTILEGTLRIGSSGGTQRDGRIGDGLGVVNLSGGALEMNSNLSSDSPTARQVSITNPINVTADSTIALSGGAANHTLGFQMDFTGALSGTGGTLNFRNDNTGACNFGNSCTFEPTFHASGFDFDRPINLLTPQGPNANRYTELRGGNISGEQEFSGVISGGGRFRRINSGGITVLSGDNTYSGGTAIDGGTLLVNNTSGSGTGTGAVAINSGGTLGGTGALSGAVTLNTGGTVAPGTSIESLDVGSLAVSGGKLSFELGAPITSDLLNVTVTNGLTITSGIVDLIDAGGLGAGTYTLIDYAGTPLTNTTVDLLTLGAQPSGFAYDLVDNPTNTTVDLVVTAAGAFTSVPEPGSMLLLLIGIGSTMIGFNGRSRRRKN